MTRNKTGMLAGLALLAVIGILFFVSKQGGDIADSYPAPAQRLVSYGFTLKNSNGAVIPTADLWVYAPLADTTNQKGEEVTASHDFVIEEDRLGQRVLHFTFTNFPPYGSKTVTVHAKIVVGRRASAHKETKADWLNEQDLIESNYPLIKAKALELKADDDRITAQAIYDFVANHIVYSGYASREKGALAAFKDKTGDCTEYAALVVALCRASGIPARYLGGYVAQQDKVLRPDDYHNWAEVFVDGYWLIIDAQEKKIGPEAKGYVAMEIVTTDKELNRMQGRHRFRVQGQGLQATMQ
jgi:transglutaminase-like putative cysteine protease